MLPKRDLRAAGGVVSEFTQVFADPCRPTAVALLKRYPSAQAIVAAGGEALTATLKERALRHYGHSTTQKLVRLASQSAASGQAATTRALSLATVRSTGAYAGQSQASSPRT